MLGFPNLCNSQIQSILFGSGPRIEESYRDKLPIFAQRHREKESCNVRRMPCQFRVIIFSLGGFVPNPFCPGGSSLQFFRRLIFIFAFPNGLDWDFMLLISSYRLQVDRGYFGCAVWARVE